MTATVRKRHAPKAPHAGMFGHGRDPVPAARKAAAARWDNRRGDLAAACREMLPQIRQTLYEILVDGKAKQADRIRAAELAAAYGFGRPASTLEVNVAHRPRPLRELSDEEIRAFLGGAPLPSQVLLEDLSGSPAVIDEHGRLLDFDPSADLVSVGREG